MNGLIFDIQRYSIHDGPGIRTVVFLKGCPLTCLWCCNPESQSLQPELEFRENLCRQCGKCVEICLVEAVNHDLTVGSESKIDTKLCNLCGDCVKSCPSGALKIIGEWKSVENVVALAERDQGFYRRSGGGVTLSGGEPLAQPDFTYELLRALYDRNIHTAVETSGHAKWSHLERIIPFTNLFLYDIKQMDSDAHLKFSGVPNHKILENLAHLAISGSKIILRVPLVPGLNDSELNLQALADLAIRISALEVHLMPFHQLGKEKYQRLNRAYTLKALPTLGIDQQGQKELESSLSLLQSRGIIVQIGG